MASTIVIDGVAYGLCPLDKPAPATCLADMEAAFEGGPATAGRPRPILERFRRRVVDHLVERGVTRREAEQAVAEIGDGRFLDWLMNGGLEAIVEAILRILAAIG